MRVPLIDIWPFPDIPSPQDWMESLAQMFADAQLGMLKLSINLLIQHSFPSLQMVQSNWFRYVTGAWLGLAQQLMPLLIVVVFVVIQLSPTRNHGVKISRLFGSIILLAAFSRLFYPAYELVTAVRDAFSKVIVDKFVVQGKHSGLADALSAIQLPTNVVGLLASSTLGMTIFALLGCVVIGLNVATIGTLALYPMAIVLRPLSFGEKLFHLSNGILAMTVISGPIMVFWLAIGYRLSTLSHQYAAGGSAFVAVFAQAATGIAALLTPITIFFLAFKKSSEVWGKVDSSVEGAMDVSSSRPLSVKQVHDQVQDNHSSFTRDVVVPTVVASIDDRPGEPLTRRLADIAATGAMAAGHPEVAAAAEVVKTRIPVTPKEGAE